jgi:hypothetical protein
MHQVDSKPLSVDDVSLVYDQPVTGNCCLSPACSCCVKNPKILEWFISPAQFFLLVALYLAVVLVLNFACSQATPSALYTHTGDADPWLIAGLALLGIVCICFAYTFRATATRTRANSDSLDRAGRCKDTVTVMGKKGFGLILAYFALRECAPTIPRVAHPICDLAGRRGGSGGLPPTAQDSTRFCRRRAACRAAAAATAAASSSSSEPMMRDG